MNTQLKVISGFILGAITGAAIGVLTAPRSGKKTRKLLAEEANRYRDDLLEKTQEQLEKAKKEYNKTLEGYTKKGKKALEGLKESITTQ